METVEHFRPKIRFPDLSYSWGNLYYCCNACQNSKLERWDDALLCPDHTEYERVKYFEFDFTTGEIKPNALASADDQQRADLTIDHYGLNSTARQRNRQLISRRWSRRAESIEEPNEWPYRDYLGL